MHVDLGVNAKRYSYFADAVGKFLSLSLYIYICIYVCVYIYVYMYACRPGRQREAIQLLCRRGR